VRGKLRIAAITLLVITAIYSLALYLSIQRYNMWKQAHLESLPSEIRPWVDFEPYWATLEGLQIFYFACFLVICWELVALIRIAKVK